MTAATLTGDAMSDGPVKTAQRTAAPKAEAIQEQGIDTLLDRLRLDGVERGELEAAAIVQKAKAEADQLVADAKKTAEAIRQEAETGAAALERAVNDGLKVAVRDATLSLKDALMHHFADDVRRLVAEKSTEPGLLDTLIRDVVSRACPADMVAKKPLSILLPKSLLDLEDLKNDSSFGEDSPLVRFAAERTKLMLEEGVTLDLAADLKKGIKLVLHDGAVEIDLSDDEIADVLLAHLQPRFRAIIEGILS